MEVPKWMTGSPGATGGPAEAPAPPQPAAPAPVAVAVPAPQRAVQVSPRPAPAVATVDLRAPAATAAPAAPAGGGAREPLLVVAGNRVRLSLTYPICAAVAGGLLVLVIGGFVLGRQSVSQPGAAPPPAAPGAPLLDRVPRKDVLGGTKPPSIGKPGAAPAAASTTRAKGKWFLVIQTLSGVTQADYDEAQRIVDFCKKEGCPATVAKYTAPRSSKQKYIVWSLMAFDAGDSEPAKAYARKIEEIGKAYFAKNKTHDFRQKSASGKFDPWFEVQR